MQAGQPVAQFTQVLRAVLVEIDRVQAEGGVQVRVAAHQVPHPLPVVLIHTEHHHALDTRGPGVGQQGRTVRVEIRKIQMGVGVDQAHAQALMIRCLKVRPTACTPGS
ncbi:hypothetical protein D3C79_901500 [compost metagenome]